MASRFVVPFTGRALGGRSPSFLDLHREVNRLFDDALRQFEGDRGGSQGDGGGGRASLAPRIDVHETDDGLELTAELAGVDRNAVEIRLDDDIVTIKGEKRKEKRDAKAHVVERSYGSFERSVQLPWSPDPDKVQANFEDGVLKIEVPRAEQQDKSRRIRIGGQEGAKPEQARKAGGEAGGAEAAGDKPAFFEKEGEEKQGGAANDPGAAKKEAETAGHKDDKKK